MMATTCNATSPFTTTTTTTTTQQKVGGKDVEFLLLDKDGDNESVASSVASVMEIEDDEHDLALELKRVVEEERSDELRPLSDFMYAHHAIAAHGCLETALAQIEGMQSCYEEYGIDCLPTTNVTQGLVAMEEFLNLHPNSLVLLDYHDANSSDADENGNGSGGGDRSVAVAWDLGKIFPERNVFQRDKQQCTDRHWKIHVRGWFYATHACYPNFECIRNGLVSLVDAHCFGWENFSTKCEQRLQEEFFIPYPCTTRKVMFYHTNVVINTLSSILKKVLPKHIQDSWEAGCKIDDGDGTITSLADVFLKPTPEIAQANILQRMQKLLQERHENEKSFRL